MFGIISGDNFIRVMLSKNGPFDELVEIKTESKQILFLLSCATNWYVAFVELYRFRVVWVNRGSLFMVKIMVEMVKEF